MYTGYYVELNEVFIKISLHTEWELLSLLFSLIFHFVHWNELHDFYERCSFVWSLAFPFAMKTATRPVKLFALIIIRVRGYSVVEWLRGNNPEK